jgi:hypothetical protein
VITRRHAGWLCAIALLSMVQVWACKLPVFRYALERWPVDRYRIVAMIQNLDEGSVKAALEALNSVKPDELNMDLEIVDLATLSEAELWQLEGVEDGVFTDRLQVFYPRRKGSWQKCWDGELTIENVEAWLDSPTRKRLAEDFVSGVSAVWILVDGQDAAVNDRVAADLQRALDHAESEIDIPNGVIPRDGASEYLSQHPDASMDDVLRCDVPLQVAFRIHRVSREDASEWATLSIIDGLGGNSATPILVPVFGRGRMLDAIATREVKDEFILKICRYMVSECSCTVKALNPGTDLLVKVNWQRELGSEILMIDFEHSGIEDASEPSLVEIPTGASSRPKRESSDGSGLGGPSEQQVNRSTETNAGYNKVWASVSGILIMLATMLVLRHRKSKTAA